MFSTTTSLIFASVLSGIIEGRYVLLSEQRLRTRTEEEEGGGGGGGEISSTQISNVAADKSTNLVIPSFAYGIISIPFTFLGAAPGPDIIQAILDRSRISTPTTMTFADSTDSSSIGNKAISGSYSTSNSATIESVAPNQQRRLTQQRWVRRSRNTIAQETRERNSTMSTPNTATVERMTAASASTTNVSSVKPIVAPNDKDTSSITKSRTATAASTAANRYQRMIRFYHHQFPPTSTTSNTNAFIIIGLQRLRILFMATGFITGFIQYYITKQQQQQQGYPPNTLRDESISSNTVIPSSTMTYPTVIRFVPFQNFNATYQLDNHEGAKFSILHMAAIPYSNHTASISDTAISVSKSSNSLDYLNPASSIIDYSYSTFLTKTDVTTNNNTTVLCEAYVGRNHQNYQVASETISPFSLPQQKCITPTQLLLSTITLQHNLLQQKDVQKPFDIVRIILTDNINNATSFSGCCHLVVHNDATIPPPSITTTTSASTIIDTKTLHIYFSHLIQYALLSAILESNRVGNDHQDNHSITNTITETSSIQESSTDTSNVSSTEQTNTSVSTTALVLSSIDSLGKRVRSTVTDTWQHIIDTVWNTATPSNVNAIMENHDPKMPQQIVYLYPINMDLFSLPEGSVLPSYANARQLWIQSIMKQHGIRTVLQKPLHVVDKENHVRKHTILFCGINDEETIASMINYFYHEKPKQQQRSSKDGVLKLCNQVICLLERQESAKLLRKLLDDDHYYLCCCLEDIQEDAFEAVRKYLMQDYTLSDIEKKLNEELYSFETLKHSAILV